MDKIDQKILQLLITNSRIPVKEISKRILLSEPSVKRRIEKMVDSGVIESYTVKINPEKLGWHISFIIKISNLKVSFQKIVKILEEYTNLTEVHAVTGNENYMVRGYAKSVRDLDVFLNKLMPVCSVHTSIILETPIERTLNV